MPSLRTARSALPRGTCGLRLLFRLGAGGVMIEINQKDFVDESGVVMDMGNLSELKARRLLPPLASPLKRDRGAGYWRSGKW